MYDISKTLYFKVLVKAAQLFSISILIINLVFVLRTYQFTYIRDHFIRDLSNSVVLATKRITMNIRYLWDADFLFFPTIYIICGLNHNLKKKNQTTYTLCAAIIYL